MAGTHSFLVTDANGCTSTATVTITERAPLVASASVSAYDFFTGTADITVSATGGTPSYSGTGVFTETDGTYTYLVTDANGCTSSVTATVAGIVDDFVVYPNPVRSTNGTVQIKMKAEQDKDMSVRITALSGKVLYAHVMHLEKGSNVRNIDVSGFTRGAYLIEVMTDDFSETTQLIVQ